MMTFSCFTHKDKYNKNNMYQPREWIYTIPKKTRHHHTIQNDQFRWHSHVHFHLNENHNKHNTKQKSILQHTQHIYTVKNVFWSKQFENIYTWTKIFLTNPTKKKHKKIITHHTNKNSFTIVNKASKISINLHCLCWNCPIQSKTKDH